MIFPEASTCKSQNYTALLNSFSVSFSCAFSPSCKSLADHGRQPNYSPSASLSPFTIHSKVYPFHPFFYPFRFIFSFRFCYNNLHALCERAHARSVSLRHSGLPLPSAPPSTALRPALVACRYLIKEKATYSFHTALFSISGMLLFRGRSMQTASKGERERKPWTITREIHKTKPRGLNNVSRSHLGLAVNII